MAKPTVFITGGSSGIGLATAQAYARQGCAIGLIARGAQGLSSAAGLLCESAGSVCVAQADVTDDAALRAAAQSLAGRLGVPDIWINCAGNGVYGMFGDVPADAFNRVTAVTYTGTVNGCRIALELMRGGGTIVNVCSAIAFHGTPLLTSYAGAKAAVRCFAQALQAELAIEGRPVRVVSVFSAAANTPFFSHAASFAAWPGRPAPPVYRPEIVARGIQLAAAAGRPEFVITGTAALFHLATRLAPGVIAFCMRQMGERMITRDQAALDRLRPSLFAPVDEQATIDGPFTGARGWSSQVAWLRLWRRVRGAGGISRRPVRPPSSPSRAIPRRAAPDRVPGGSALPPGAA